MNHATLPDLEALHPRELKALIVEQHKQILIHHEQLQSRDAEIEHLKLLLAKLRRMQFGRSSQKVNRQIEQLELRLGELEQSRALEAESPEGIAQETVAVRPARRPLPAHLRREVQTYLPQQKACPDCGGELKHLGEDVREILEYVPERVKVIRQVHPKLACAGCDRIVQAPAPSRAIERSIAGRDFWRICWSRSIAIIFRCIVKRRSRARRRGNRSLDPGGMGRWNEPAASAPGRSVASRRDAGTQSSRR